MATQHLAYAGASDWLNRLSWLRTDTAFLNRALTSSRSRFLILRNFDPLVVPASSTGRQLAFVTYPDVQTYIRKDHFADEPGTASQPNLKDRPLVLFLGLDERSAAGSFLPDSNQASAYDNADAYFALDATNLPELVDLAKSKAGAEADFLELRSGGALLPGEQLATASIARALADWHRRNPFCAGCGRKTIDVQAGWKRYCPPDTEPERPPCPTRKGVHNISVNKSEHFPCVC
jgi:NAD+ diphosphatase